MPDQTEKINNSLIQHGKDSDRLYLMKLALEDNPQEILKMIEEKVAANDYSKIFAKVPETKAKVFFQAGFKQEAFVPCFYTDKDKGLFLAKYPQPARAQLDHQQKEHINKVIKLAREKGRQLLEQVLPFGVSIDQAGEEDADELAKLYKRVFDSYPFPIFDPQYIKKTMETHVDYYCAREKEHIVAASSAEIDCENKNAELTDFATLKQKRGLGLALFLLSKMEENLAKKGIRTFFTIARALSYGMNITFAKAGYKYSGTLINNTNIAGQIESMNVWYKVIK